MCRYNRIYSCSLILGLKLSTLVHSFLDVTHHVEGGLWEVVTLTGKKLSETINGVLKVNESTFETGEDFSNTEWL